MFEALKPGKDRIVASATAVLRDSEESMELQLHGHPLKLLVRRGSERESEEGLVRVVVGNQDVALLFSRETPPLGLLLRLAKHMGGLGWPQPVLSHLDGMVHLCPKVFTKAVKDDTVTVLVEDEVKDVDERGAELANAALSVVSVLYSHGYRETTRNFWKSYCAPISSVVSGFGFAGTPDSVSFWGNVPAELLARLESEFTNAPFTNLPSCDAGFGLPGKRFRFAKQAMGKQQRTMSLLQMRGVVSAMVKKVGLHLSVGSWSQHVLLFIQVVSANSTVALKKPSAAQAARISMGSQLDDEVLDPLAARLNPEFCVVISGDLPGLVSDVLFRTWPVDELPFRALLAGAGLEDLEVSRENPEVLLGKLAETSKWKDLAWRGGRSCRILKEALWLSVAQASSERGFLIPLPHFALSTTAFAKHNEEGLCRHMFVTLVLEREQGTVVEVHSLGQAKTLSEKLKLLNAIGSMSVVDDNLLTIRVPGSKCLIEEARAVTAAIMEDQFDDKEAKKMQDKAESKSYAVLMSVLSEVCAQCNMEPLTVSWRNTMSFVRDTMSVLARQMKKDQLYTASSVPSLSSSSGQGIDFARMRWTSVSLKKREKQKKKKKILDTFFFKDADSRICSPRVE